MWRLQHTFNFLCLFPCELIWWPLVFFFHLQILETFANTTSSKTLQHHLDFCAWDRERERERERETDRERKRKRENPDLVVHGFLWITNPLPLLSVFLFFPSSPCASVAGRGIIPWGINPLLPPLLFMTSIKRWEMHEETTLLRKQCSPTNIHSSLLFLSVAILMYVGINFPVFT